MNINYALLWHIVLGCVLAGVILSVAFHYFKLLRAFLARCKAVSNWHDRERAQVVKVGEIQEHPSMQGAFALPGWEFAKDYKGPPTSCSPDGEFAFYGYTIPELRELAQRREEFA